MHNFASLIFAVGVKSAKTAKIMHCENLALYGNIVQHCVPYLVIQLQFSLIADMIVAPSHAHVLLHGTHCLMFVSTRWC